MSDDEKEHDRMLRAFLYGTDDGRRPIRGRFVVSQGQRPPAEVPIVPSGRAVTVDAGTPGARTAELHAIEARETAEERLRIAARQFRRPGRGGLDLA